MMDSPTELPLSFSQERIWALSRIDPEHHSSDSISQVMDIKGRLDIAALEKSINEVVRRHQVLRTSCKTIGGRPVQTVVAELQSAFSVQDLQDISQVENERKRPLELEHPPLLRAKLFRVREGEYLLVLTTHLFAFDGWSRGILNQEISELYNNFSQGKESPLPELSSQYIDFVRWHHRWFIGDNFTRQKNYWIKKLAGAEVLLDLPFANNREQVTSRGTGVLSFALPGFLTKAAREIAGYSKATLFMVLMAAFQTLLYRYTDRKDISVGTIVSNRRRAESESNIGSFANNILIRSDFSSVSNFWELIDMVRGTMTEGYANQDIPFEKLIGELDGELNRTPLFGTMFVFHRFSKSANLQLSGLQVKKSTTEHSFSQHDLNLVMTDNGKNLSGLLEYNLQLFDASMIKKFPDNFMVILKKVTDDPELPLAELPSFVKTKDMASVKVRSASTYVSPRTELEKAIVEIWQDLFKIEQIGIDDDFFDLGGHSLLGVSLIAKIQEFTGRPLPLPALFRLTTIAQFAAAIETSDLSPVTKPARANLPKNEYRQMLAAIAGGKIPPVKPGSLITRMNQDGSKNPIFWCFNAPGAELPAIADHLGKERPIYGLFSGSGVLARTDQIFRALAEHYVEEIISVHSDGPYLLGGNCDGANVISRIAYNLLERNRKVERLCLLEFFDERLFNYPGAMLLMYGKKSHLKAYRPFRWRKLGWKKAFTTVPKVAWVPGAHGQFFTEPNVRHLAAEVKAFLPG